MFTLVSCEGFETYPSFAFGDGKKGVARSNPGSRLLLRHALFLRHGKQGAIAVVVCDDTRADARLTPHHDTAAPF